MSVSTNNIKVPGSTTQYKPITHSKGTFTQKVFAVVFVYMEKYL